MSEKFLLIAAFFTGVLLFGLINKNGGTYDLRTRLDRYIPFVPAFVIPYISLFPYIAFAGYVLFEHEVAMLYYSAMALTMCSAVFVWFLVPAKMARPRVQKNKFFEGIVFRIYEGDLHANAFPSSHVFTSLVTSYFLAIAFPAYAVGIWIVGACIAVSTVLIKQHFAVDLFAGILWAYAGVGVAHMFFA